MIKEFEVEAEDINDVIIKSLGGPKGGFDEAIKWEAEVEYIEKKSD